MAIKFPYAPKNGALGANPLRLHCVLTVLFVAVSTPADDPVKCAFKNTNCTVTNSYGTFPDRDTCRASRVVYPITESELVHAVAAATRTNRKMRAVTRFSHSIPKLACAGGDDGLLISTKFLNRTIKTDAVGMTVTVQSGVTLRQLIEEAAMLGLALPCAPYWWGLTVGGMMGTGAHGSSLWGKGSAVHDYVEEIRIVSPGTAKDGFVNVRVLNESTRSEFDAAKLSLGVLGVISQVTFKLEPMFKRSITYVMKSDSDLGDEAAAFGKKHEFGDMFWYPSQGKVVYRIDDRVSSDNSRNGLYDFIPFRSQPWPGLEAIRSTEETQESQGDADGKCTSGKATTSALFAAAYGLTNDGILFTGYPVIGDNNRVMSSGSCLDHFEDGTIMACPWESRIKGEFFYETSVSISLSKVKNFILDIQKLVQLEPRSLCGLELYNGILARYVTRSPAYLGKQEEALEFDITYYRSQDPLSPRIYEDIIEEIEQMALFKYNALPHWGKNRNIAFFSVIKKYKNADEFLKVKDSYDPLGLFSSEWTDQILGLKGNATIVKQGCALEGLCICSEDEHCAPSKGYFCRPGKVYKDARVCSRINNGMSSFFGGQV